MTAGVGKPAPAHADTRTRNLRHDYSNLDPTHTVDLQEKEYGYSIPHF